MISENVRLDPEMLKKVGVFSLVSGEIAIAVGGGYFLGERLDQYLWQGQIIFAIIFPLLGLGYCVWRIRQMAKTLWDK